MFYLAKKLIIVLIPFCLISCNSKSDKKEIIENENGGNGFKKDQNEWVNTFNNDFQNINSQYFESAVLADVEGNVYDKKDSRKLFFEQLKQKIKKVKSTKVHKNEKVRKKIEYEIGSFSNTDGNLFKYLMIWNEKNGKKLRELEVIVEASEVNPDLKEIDLAREKWVKLCNQHNANDLVENLYAKNAIYYNHKPVIVGVTDISKEYSYMNNPKYNLLLTPIIVEPVNNEVVLEIGQCSGTYGGKYVIVWKRQGNNEWKVLLDSNV